MIPWRLLLLLPSDEFASAGTGVVTISGPFCSVASQSHSPGHIAGQPYTAGTQSNQAYVSGSVAAGSC